MVCLLFVSCNLFAFIAKVMVFHRKVNLTICGLGVHFERPFLRAALDRKNPTMLFLVLEKSYEASLEFEVKIQKNMKTVVPKTMFFANTFSIDLGRIFGGVGGSGRILGYFLASFLGLVFRTLSKRAP